MDATCRSKYTTSPIRYRLHPIQIRVHPRSKYTTSSPTTLVSGQKYATCKQNTLHVNPNRLVSRSKYTTSPIKVLDLDRVHVVIVLWP